MNDNISRSQFLREGLSHFSDFMANSVERKVGKTVGKAVLPILRPPGALPELEFLSACTRCDKCIIACPHNSLYRAESLTGVAVATPKFDPTKIPCYMCDDLPCIDACEEPALSRDNGMKMGTARVILTRCFAHQGQVCDYCFDRCPEKGEAITMNKGKPIVNDEKCTGCGICSFVCPAPGEGIMIIPRKAV